MVCPATEKHIKKYQRKESFLVEETEEDYKNITLPYIQKQSFSVQVSPFGVLLLLQSALWSVHCSLFPDFYLPVGLQHLGEEGRG